jgi:DNA-binding transcriptional LysR family regulator
MLDWDNLRIFLELTRSQGLVDASKKLGIDHSTVSRRMRRFEEQVGSQLFERNNQGYTLTAEGHRLVKYAELIEITVSEAGEELGGHNPLLSGQVRLGTTEAFGMVIVAPHMAQFCMRHPHITVDLLPVPRFVNLSKREADISVTIDRPQSGNYVVTKLCDYTLKLYATPAYLASHPPIHEQADLASHRFVGYIDDLVYSEELRYERNVAPTAFRAFRSTSVIAQYMHARNGKALAILPYFLAQMYGDLVPVLNNQITITRTLWLVVANENRHVGRISTLWNYLREVVELNHAFLLGDASDMQWVP